MRRFFQISILLLLIAPIFSCSNSSNSATDVKQVISQFGEQIKKVSLLAPDSLLIPQLKKVYQPYVSEELLLSWVTNPSNAPGRRVSSPWPEKIEIVQLSRVKDGLYRVKGEVIYVTSVEETNGGKAYSRAVIIEVKKTSEGEWRISSYRIEE